MTVIAEYAQGLTLRQFEIVDQTALLLPQALTRVESDRRGIGTVPVRGECGGREAERILSVRPRNDIRDERQATRIVQLEIEFSVERFAEKWVKATL